MVKIQSQIPILNHFSIPLTIAEEGILEDLLVSHTATILGKMTNTDKKMNNPAFASGLIWKCGFERQITFARDFGLGGGLRPLSSLGIAILELIINK